MSLEARMRRELKECEDAYEDHPVFASHLQRRIHLLRFVLSGRYAELQRKTQLDAHLRRMHGYEDCFLLFMSATDMESDHNYDHNNMKKAGYAYPVHPRWRLDL